MKQTNLKCINCDSVGYNCIALVEIHDGCLDGTCPFYKTEYEFKISEDKARRRLEALGVTFKSRSSILNELSYKQKYDKKYNEDHKRIRILEQPKKVLKYNTVLHEYTEYEDLEHASSDTGIPINKLVAIIRKDEEYHGYKYTYV